jgi:acetyltransferase-like isoleucine patch superfamily enzyme
VLRGILKSVVHAVFLVVMLPAAGISGFGRVRPLFEFFAQACAMAPGLPGDYLRIAFYKLTLLECSLSSHISFGTFFAHREARVGPRVYIGSYCVLGKVNIGEGTQIASAVQILSGGRQHARDSEGRISGSGEGEFTPVTIGADCWLGASAVVMADVGPGSTIGAASVVSRPIPAGSVAVGSPARVIRSATDR